MARKPRRKREGSPSNQFEVLLNRDDGLDDEQDAHTYRTVRLPAVPDGVAPAGDAGERQSSLPVPASAPPPPAPRASGRHPVPASEPRAPLPPALASSAGLPALAPRRPSGAIVIPGSGRPMGRGYIHARRRPLAMQLAMLVLIVCIVASALIAVAPLQDGGASAQAAFPLEGIANAVIWHATPGYSWYTAAAGDTVESIAQRFHCQIGGFYEMNGLLAGEEVQIGKAYKVPSDPYYGLYYRPPSYVFTGSGYGQTTYTDHIWSSNAGVPPPGAYCAPTPRGSGDNMYNYDLASFDLKSPNWGAYWVRGFTWYHFGVDLANPMGTPIHAAQSGEVIFAAWDTGGGGWSVKINHCNHLATAYGHMETLLVHVHQMVHAGDVIGLEGSTGWSTGPHVHFSVQWDNLAVDPMLYFDESKYNITHFIQD